MEFHTTRFKILGTYDNRNRQVPYLMEDDALIRVVDHLDEVGKREYYIHINAPARPDHGQCQRCFPSKPAEDFRKTA